MLTIFVGVMMGVAQANMAIRMLSEKFAKEVIKRLPLWGTERSVNESVG